MTSSDTWWSTLKRKKLCRIYYLFYCVGPRRGGGHGSNCIMKFWIVKWENMNESGPAGIEVVRIFCPNLVCSCFGPQVVHRWKGLPRLVWNWPYTTWPVVCRIVNWMGLTAYNMTSPLNIWTKFGVWLPRRLCGPPSKEENCVVSIGGRLYCKLKFWMVKRENMNESGPAGIEVGRIFYPNSVCSLPWTTSSPPVKGDYHVFSNTGFIRHCAVVCRIVNRKGLTGFNVTSPLNIWTKLGVWLLRTLFGRPSTWENCVISIFYSIEWRGAVCVCVGGGGVGWMVTVKCEYSTYYSSLFGPE